ncbi:hypothetical protein [Shewanella algae]|jgi:hypothetical protein|uniref:Uncharacterized protein n=1 Tax=Shewanella algae TaxID=38313 RepID=A0A7T8EFT7_9GAMM|nr:hypothetical protein [Shewanella algae]MBO2554551.1 hypothetical protein [Shewanella algae]MBO2567265.1 hypothetical protein [Shewanella algae]MBO2605549.1 hypothetical protein [Shewanella algae]MBO2614084.1 hypothetical protein [Shewanella algae]MBO2634924.1 hypothetical protein [Shewanella algae]
MKLLQRLSHLEQRKLSELAEQKQALQQRQAQVQGQQQQVALLESHYSQFRQGSIVGLCNSQALLQRLQPLKQSLNTQQQLLGNEQQRLQGLWLQQLGRYQRVNWFDGQQQQRQRRRLEQQEQFQLDELAGGSTARLKASGKLR